VEGVVICGTGNQSWLRIIAGKVVAACDRLIVGDRYRTKFIKFNSFLGYQSRIENPRTKNDWLTRDEKIVDWYSNEKYCTFDFTVNGFRGLFDVLSFIQKKKNIKKIPSELPIFMISGGEDPVGKYGKDVKKIYKQYKNIGISDITLKLYKDDRHEILNELDRLDVYNDVLRWIDERTRKND
jgi:alpha-beta hydrolase superfamily lysophospholipase